MQGPWEYVQSVPLVFYGEGFIESNGDLHLERDLDLTDLTATLADLLEVDLPHAVGQPIEEALVPQEQRSGAPKLIVTVVWDGGGWNLLNRWPNEWPNLRSLMERGTSVMGVTVGSSPSTTPAVHSTIGTGAFPRDHGAVDIPIRRNGKMVASFGDFSADDVVIPTIADVYDLETNNEAKVAMIGEKAWHLGMLGHGASIEGGDKDVAVMWNLHHKLITNPAHYTLPSNLDGSTPSGWATTFSPIAESGATVLCGRCISRSCSDRWWSANAWVRMASPISCSPTSNTST